MYHFVDVTGNSSTFSPTSGSSGYFDMSIVDEMGREGYYASPVFNIITDQRDPGDANDDGLIDIMDLVAIIDHIVYGSPVASELNADANQDNVIDIMDLVWIIDAIVGA